jgi:hypothetical protein
MRVYIMSSDGITLCREPPAAVNEDEIVVASKIRRCENAFRYRASAHGEMDARQHGTRSRRTEIGNPQ